MRRSTSKDSSAPATAGTSTRLVGCSGRAGSRDIIKTGGANVSPLEVDEALAQHSSVKVAKTVGVPHKTLGEVVVACVVPHDGASRRSRRDPRILARTTGELQGAAPCALLPRGRHRAHRQRQDQVRRTSRLGHASGSPNRQTSHVGCVAVDHRTTRRLPAFQTGVEKGFYVEPRCEATLVERRGRISPPRPPREDCLPAPGPHDALGWRVPPMPSCNALNWPETSACSPAVTSIVAG